MNIYNKKLYRSKDNRVILGVLGGLGEYFDIDPSLLRVLYVCLSVFSAGFPGIIAYILMAIIMPERPNVVHEKAQS